MLAEVPRLREQHATDQGVAAISATPAQVPAFPISMSHTSSRRWFLPVRRDNVTLLTIINFLVYVSFGTTGPTMTIYLQDLGASFSQISLILTTSGLAGLAGHYFWGRIADRLGHRKPIIVVSLLAVSGSLSLLTLARSYQLVWILRISDWIMLAAYTTVSLALIGDELADEQRSGRRMGLYRGIGSFAFALGAVISGIIVNRLGFVPSYLFAAASYLLAGLCALWLQEQPLTAAPAKPATAEPRDQFRLNDPVTLAFLVGVILWSAAHSAQASMFPNFVDHLGLPEGSANWLWGIAALAEGLLMPGIGFLSESWGNLVLILSSGLSLALVMAGYVAARTWPALPTLIGAQPIRGWGYASFTVTSMLHVSLQGSRQTRAGNVGMYGVAMSAGNIIGLAVGGQLVEFRGFAFLFLCAAGGYLASSVLFWIMYHIHRMRDATPISAS